ncbi:hypothetical protein LSH36_2155g00004 [Paralvinella palmiformis]|uniref:Uncharacterized protein n=1 Tax=Paralvinella palmiformis TaxID=53620 RepID=A0AAD9IRE0_9ANNE|nr:hypothetical protein LSH36_2155g00004 [Paralvinella palmiformis]
MDKTLVNAVFTKDPEITILEGRAEIHFIISGPLTHILEENCVMITNICDKATIAVPTKQHLRSSQYTDVHDFTTYVPLADPEAIEILFSFWIDMYNQTEDLGYNNPTMTVNGSSVDIVQVEVGPITGDTYAPVIKSGNHQQNNKPKLPVKPQGAGTEFVYENVTMSDITQGQHGFAGERQRHHPFNLGGVDGTTYADLCVIGKPSETGKVHGKENKVIYTDIELIKR